MRRQLQIFIHRHYENIKLVLLVVILTLIGYGILAILSDSAADSKARGDAVIRIVKSVERESDKQTKIINRQFQALCFLLVETSGADTLKQLDPPLEEQCRNLTRELKAEAAAQQRTAQPQAVLPTQPKPATRPQPRQTPPDAPARPETANNPSDAVERSPSALERLARPLDYLWDELRGLLP